MSEAVFDENECFFFDGDDAKLTYRGYDDLLFDGTMRNSPPEATTTLFLTGTMRNSPTKAEKPPPT